MHAAPQIVKFMFIFFVAATEAGVVLEPSQNAGFVYAFTSSTSCGPRANSASTSSRWHAKSATALRMASSFDPAEVMRSVRDTLRIARYGS